ncbi:MAG: TolC family protein, partial [Candidatus Acidiferrales bacterium]
MVPLSRLDAATAPVSLEELVREALEKNPGLQSALRRVEAQRRRVSQAQALPDPRLSVGWMGNVKPFGVMRDDPSSFRSLTATQEIPYPGKLKLRGQAAGLEVEAARWDYEAARRQVVAEVKAAYYEYAYARKATEVAGKNGDLLERMERISEARYRVGKGLQQDVLRAQVEVLRLRQRLTLLEQQTRTAQARLNALLGRDPETPLGPAGALDPVELAVTLESLFQSARENDPSLHREQQRIERQQVLLALARKQYYPDFEVGYTYWNRPLLPDMHGFMVGLNIPVFYRSKQRQEVSEATEELLSARRSRENQEVTVLFAVKEHYLAAQASQELARLYSQAIVPQSSLALESALAAYEVGSVDFQTVLESFSTVLNYEADYYRELANVRIALA